MGTTKMTAREFLNAVIAANLSDEMNAKATEMIEALDRRNEKRKTSETSNQKANSEIKLQILEAFRNNEIELIDGCITSKTVSNYMNKINKDLNSENLFSSQKSTALLGQMVKEGTLATKEVKSKSGKVKGYYVVETAED